MTNYKKFLLKNGPYNLLSKSGFYFKFKEKLLKKRKFKYTFISLTFFCGLINYYIYKYVKRLYTNSNNSIIEKNDDNDSLFNQMNSIIIDFTFSNNYRNFKKNPSTINSERLMNSIYSSLLSLKIDQNNDLKIRNLLKYLKAYTEIFDRGFKRDLFSGYCDIFSIFLKICNSQKILQMAYSEEIFINFVNVFTNNCLSYFKEYNLNKNKSEGFFELNSLYEESLKSVIENSICSIFCISDILLFNKFHLETKFYDNNSNTNINDISVKLKVKLLKDLIASFIQSTSICLEQKESSYLFLLNLLKDENKTKQYFNSLIKITSIFERQKFNESLVMWDITLKTIVKSIYFSEYIKQKKEKSKVNVYNKDVESNCDDLDSIIFQNVLKTILDLNLLSVLIINYELNIKNCDSENISKNNLGKCSKNEFFEENIISILSNLNVILERNESYRKLTLKNEKNKEVELDRLKFILNKNLNNDGYSTVLKTEINKLINLLI